MIAVVGLPFFVPTYVTLAINSYYAFLWGVFICFAIRTQTKISKRMKRSTTQQEQHEGAYKSIMATFVYREPLKLILKTLKNISEQSLAKEMIMSVCMEERTPDREDKIKEIFAQFGGSFGQLVVTVHPFGTAGEIPGKCSNNNYAIRAIAHYLKSQDPNFNPEDYYVTDFDVDTSFHPDSVRFNVKPFWKRKIEAVWSGSRFFTIIGILISSPSSLGSLVLSEIS